MAQTEGRELGRARRRRSSAPPGRRFDFDRDSFAFANELLWEYGFDPAAGRAAFRRRHPAPAYAHRCFVLVRAARQFLYHARFDPTLAACDDDGIYRRRIRAVMRRSPRAPCPPEELVVFPGYASLRAFSAAQSELLKSACGAAWRSYVLRSHWRMVFPISRRHQARTAGRIVEGIEQGDAPIVHLVMFPRLSINHGMVVFGLSRTAEGTTFHAYDPNDPSQPTALSFDRPASTFRLPANRYWAGGAVDVIEIYRSWLM